MNNTASLKSKSKQAQSEFSLEIHSLNQKNSQLLEENFALQKRSHVIQEELHLVHGQQKQLQLTVNDVEVPLMAINSLLDKKLAHMVNAVEETLTSVDDYSTTDSTCAVYKLNYDRERARLHFTL